MSLHKLLRIQDFLHTAKMDLDRDAREHGDKWHKVAPGAWAARNAIENVLHFIEPEISLETEVVRDRQKDLEALVEVTRREQAELNDE